MMAMASPVSVGRAFQAHSFVLPRGGGCQGEWQVVAPEDHSFNRTVARFLADPGQFSRVVEVVAKRSKFGVTTFGAP